MEILLYLSYYSYQQVDPSLRLKTKTLEKGSKKGVVAILSGVQEVVLVLELERVAEYWYTGIPDIDKVFGGARFALLCLGLMTFQP